MYVDLYRQRGKELPAEIDLNTPVQTLLPIAA